MDVLRYFKLHVLLLSILMSGIFLNSVRAECFRPDDSHPDLTGKMRLWIILQGAKSGKAQSVIEATVPFRGSTVRFSVQGLEPDIYLPVIRMASGSAILGRGAAAPPFRFKLSARGASANVVLGCNDQPRLMGPQTQVDLVLDIKVPPQKQ